MSPARATSRRALPRHIHLPSVHVRTKGAGFDYDYDYDLYVGNKRQIRRIITFRLIAPGDLEVVRVTEDDLCPEEAADIREELPTLLDEDNPEALTAMQALAALEFERQARIAAGAEHSCFHCGCSESKSCSGGCFWATPNLCSRCV
jgi:hypothetical protein